MCKINGMLFNALKKEIDSTLVSSPFDSYKEMEDHYITNKIGNDHAMRARWDLFYLLDRTIQQNFINKVYYELNANDNHIDTALKRITGIR